MSSLDFWAEEFFIWLCKIRSTGKGDANKDRVHTVETVCLGVRLNLPLLAHVQVEAIVDVLPHHLDHAALQSVAALRPIDFDLFVLGTCCVHVLQLKLSTESIRKK